MASDQDNLISIQDLKADLSGLVENHRDIFTSPSVQDCRQTAENWLQWCRQHKNVKVVEYEVPNGILPSNQCGALFDVKVDTRGPDDALYNRSPEIRRKIARGNTLLRTRNAATNTSQLEFVVFALRKFTGGMGDEDENQPEDDTVWKRYFLKPFEESKKIVVLEKENGEAAHLSVRYIDGKFYFIGGSKNVHLIFRNHKDIEKYTEARFHIAKIVCKTIIDFLNNLATEKKVRLLSLLSWTKMTVIMEILQPTYQHVVDLSHLSQPELKFLCFTEPYTDQDTHTSLTSLPPNKALEIGRKYGLNPTKYEIIPVQQFEDKMKETRQGKGYEGSVFYFLDQDENTIGLLKKKTVWYILLRAIREKISYSVVEYKKNPGGFKDTEILKNRKKIEKRIDEIQRWLSLTPDETKHWKSLGNKYLVWIIQKLKQKCDVDYGDRSKFPIHWKLFQSEYKLSDDHTLNSADVAMDGGDNQQDMEEEQPVQLLEHIPSSPMIRVDDPQVQPNEDTLNFSPVGCIFRNLDFVGKNENKIQQIIDRINNKALKKKSKGYLVLFDLDKINSNLNVKKEAISTDDITNVVPVIYAHDKMLASPIFTCPDTQISEDTMNALAVVFASSTDEGKKILGTLIQQLYHSGTGSRSVKKGIIVEKVKIEYENGEIETFPDDLGLPVS